MTKNILKFFDRLEDKTRAKLSRTPLLYAFIGGIGVVLFWRGVWHTADLFSQLTFYPMGLTPFLIIDGPVSLVLGTLILLVTGVFVSSFIGNRLIISGLSGDKKLAEKTQEEIRTEEDDIQDIKEILDRVEKKIENIEHKV